MAVDYDKYELSIANQAVKTAAGYVASTAAFLPSKLINFFVGLLGKPLDWWNGPGWSARKAQEINDGLHNKIMNALVRMCNASPAGKTIIEVVGNIFGWIADKGTALTEKLGWVPDSVKAVKVFEENTAIQAAFKASLEQTVAPHTLSDEGKAIVSKAVTDGLKQGKVSLANLKQTAVDALATEAEKVIGENNMPQAVGTKETRAYSMAKVYAETVYQNIYTEMMAHTRKKNPNISDAELEKARQKAAHVAQEASGVELVEMRGGEPVYKPVGDGTYAIFGTLRELMQDPAKTDVKFKPVVSDNPPKTSAIPGDETQKTAALALEAPRNTEHMAQLAGAMKNPGVTADPPEAHPDPISQSTPVNAAMIAQAARDAAV